MLSSLSGLCYFHPISSGSPSCQLRHMVSIRIGQPNVHPEEDRMRSSVESTRSFGKQSGECPLVGVIRGPSRYPFCSEINFFWTGGLFINRHKHDFITTFASKLSNFLPNHHYSLLGTLGMTHGRA